VRSSRVGSLGLFRRLRSISACADSSGTGIPPSLSRVIARYDPAEYERLRRMPLEEMMCYMLLQSANAASDEMKKRRR
jgi:hypothetical protein